MTGFESWEGQQVFFFFKTSKPALGTTQPPTEWTPGSFPRVNVAGRVAYHSLQSSAEVKNEWSYASTPLYTFMVWTGKNFTFIGLLFKLMKLNVL
jgi:hypothetical protein